MGMHLHSCHSFSVSNMKVNFSKLLIIQAKKYMMLFGDVLFIDVTFGITIYGFKTVVISIVDCEGLYSIPYICIYMQWKHCEYISCSILVHALFGIGHVHEICNFLMPLVKDENNPNVKSNGSSIAMFTTVFNKLCEYLGEEVCAKLKDVVLNCDDEKAIKLGLKASKLKSRDTNFTCCKHGQWSNATMKLEGVWYFNMNTVVLYSIYVSL